MNEDKTLSNSRKSYVVPAYFEKTLKKTTHNCRPRSRLSPYRRRSTTKDCQNTFSSSMNVLTSNRWPHFFVM